MSSEQPCWNCQAPIFWVGGIKLDADPVPDGPFILRRGAAVDPPPALLNLLTFEPRYQEHRCPPRSS